MMTRRPFVVLRVEDGVESLVGGAFSPETARAMVMRAALVRDLAGHEVPVSSVRVVSGAPVVEAFVVKEVRFVVIRNPNPNGYFQAG